MKTTRYSTRKTHRNPATGSEHSKTPALKHPEYYLENVPQHLRVRLLDLCFRRLYHDALELLREHSFDHYTVDDLVNFYHWAPLLLPDQPAPAPEPPPVPRDYDQPSAEQVEEMRKRLAEVPSDVLERVEHALRHDSTDTAASLLWHAGVGFTSAELYELRKTLFPPNSLVDPYTSGVPCLRPEPASEAPTPPSAEDHGQRTTDNRRDQIPPSVQDVPAPASSDPQMQPADSAVALGEIRRRLLQFLASRIVDARMSAEPPNSSIAPATDPLIHQSANPPKRRPSKRSPKSQQRLDDVQQPVDPAALLCDLRDLIARHVVLPDMAAEALALWVVHTYAFALRQVTTYIGVVSPEKRCGKTTLLELLARLAFRSLPVSNITPSALFKVIQETSPTLLIDEADTFLQGRDELAGILNAGYRKDNSYVVRVGDANTSGTYQGDGEPEFGEWTNERPDGTSADINFARYSCWCPKVIAGIGRLPDALADRCILVTMQRKLPGEKCARLRKLNATEHRKRCAAFVHQHRDAIAGAEPEIPAALNDRAADIWEPLLAIADIAGGDWPALARQAALKLSAGDDDELTLIGYFLRDIRAHMLEAKIDRVLSRDLVALLNPLHNRPWEDLRRGREINEYWLSQRMKELGIRSRNVRTGDSVARGYVVEDVEAAYRRYVREPEPHMRNGGAPG